MTEQNAALFRRRAFEADWLGVLEGAGLDPRLGSPLWDLLLAEGEQWLYAGQRIGYFGEGASDFPTSALEVDLEIPPYEAVSPAAFATDLALAYESLTPEHVRFLHLAMFAAEPEWTEALAEVTGVVEQFVHRPQSSFFQETIDEIAWCIEGPVEKYDDATPSRWRTGIMLVYSATRSVLRVKRARRYELLQLTNRLLAAVREEVEEQASAIPAVRVARRPVTRSEGYEIITRTEAAAEAPQEGDVGGEHLAAPESYEEFFEQGEDA